MSYPAIVWLCALLLNRCFVGRPQQPIDRDLRRWASETRRQAAVIAEPEKPLLTSLPRFESKFRDEQTILGHTFIAAGPIETGFLDATRSRTKAIGCCRRRLAAQEEPRRAKSGGILQRVGLLRSLGPRVVQLRWASQRVPNALRPAPLIFRGNLCTESQSFMFPHIEREPDRESNSSAR